MTFPPHATVLEIGCAEADWMSPMLAVRPDLQMTGIDWRAARRPGTVIRGDVLVQYFPTASFDVMVGISSIEHIGLGHYDHDPTDHDGDRHCMERVVRWVKPGGWVYLDVPYGAEYAVKGTSHRVYNHAAIAGRLMVPGLTERQRWYCAHTDVRHPQAAPPPETDDMVYVALYATKD